MSKLTAKQVGRISKQNISGSFNKYFTVGVICAIAVIFAVVLLEFIVLVAPKTAEVLLQTLGIIVYSVFILFPLVLGLIRYTWKLTTTSVADISDFTHYFSSSFHYLRAIRFSVVIIIRLSIYAFFCFLPLIIVTLLNASWLYVILRTTPPIWAASLTYVASYLNFFGIIMFLFSSAKLYLSSALIVTDDKMTSLESLHVSTIIASEHLPSFIKLILRNFLYILATLLIFPALYTIPYLSECYIIHCKSVFDEYNSKINTVEQFY